MKNLKKLAAMIMLSLLIAFTFTSCGNDDKDDEPINSGTQSKSLIGRWLLVSVERVAKENGNILSRREVEDHGLITQYEFKNNGIFQLFEGDKIEEGTYYTEDNALFMFWDSGKPFKGLYNITILSLTFQELKLQFYYSYYFEGDFEELIWNYTFMKVKQ